MARKKKGSQYQQKQQQNTTLTPPQQVARFKTVRPKEISDSEMAKRYETDMGEDFTLVYLRRLAFPYYKVRVGLIAAGKPEKDTLQIQSILLRLVKAQVDTEETIKEFLGLQPPYFVINELFTLLRLGAISTSKEGKYVVTEYGEQILLGTAWLSITATTDFEFAIDGTTGELVEAREFYPHHSEIKINGLFEGKTPSFKWLNEKWVALCAIFQSQNEGKELVDFANHKHSILWGDRFHEDHFVFGYAHKEDTSMEIQFRVRNQSEKELKDKVPVVKELLGELPNLMFDEDIAEIVLEQESNFQEERKRIREEAESLPSEEYKELKNLEVRDEMLKAVQTAKTAILIESPWIKKATERLLPDLEKFLDKGGKVCILYGIDGRNQHEAHVLELVEKLRDKHRPRMYLVSLPDHFKNTMIEMSGTHRKILIKDSELTIKGSFNYLSNNADASEKFAAEEATIFFSKSAQRWTEIFEEYSLPKKFLDFLNPTTAPS